MEGTRECSQREVEPQAEVHRRHEAERHNEVKPCPEAETQQMLPLESTARSRTNSVRSLRASISDISSPSNLEPSSKRKYLSDIIATN